MLVAQGLSREREGGGRKKERERQRRRPRQKESKREREEGGEEEGRECVYVGEGCASPVLSNDICGSLSAGLSMWL